MPSVEFNDDTAALEYIRARGYASYSSIKNVRDCVVPSYSDAAWFKFGKELHSRLLENKITEKLSVEEELILTDMLYALRNNAIVKRLLAKSRNEIDFGPLAALKKYGTKTGILVPSVQGVPVYGRIDILNADNICDLKSTKITSRQPFIDSMDFLQASVYMKVTGRKDFYYIGACKQKPYTVTVFNVREFPERLAAAELELRRLLMYIKSKL